MSSWCCSPTTCPANLRTPHARRISPCPKRAFKAGGCLARRCSPEQAATAKATRPPEGRLLETYGRTYGMTSAAPDLSLRNMLLPMREVGGIRRHKNGLIQPYAPVMPSRCARRGGLILAKMTPPQRRPDWTPASRDGVSPSRLAVMPGSGGTVAAYLTARLRSGIDWPARMAQGNVLDGQGRALAADAPCTPGQVIWYWRSLPPEPRVPFELELLHCDEHLVVVDKPHFLASIPGGRYLQETVQVRLRRLLGNDELMPLHRLDRETAGVLLFSAQPATRNAYHALLREQRMHKVYEAVAPWRSDLPLPLTARHRLLDAPDARHLPMRVVAGEPNAQTQVELLRRLGRRGVDGGPVLERAQELAQEPAQELALYRLTPVTGRRHQLRAQLNALGLPIVGDRIYPSLWPEPAAGAPPNYTRPLQLLARELAFTDPVSGAPRRFVSARRLALADLG